MYASIKNQTRSKRVFFLNSNSMKGMFLYSVVSSPLDRSKSFTRHLMADLFIPAPTWLLWKAFQPCSNYTRRPFAHISTTVYSQVVIYTAESIGTSMEKTKMPKFRYGSRGDSNPHSLDCESGILQLSYRAPRHITSALSKQPVVIGTFLTL